MPRKPVRALPRKAMVPFDSEYKFMATFHDRPASDLRRHPARTALHQREGRTRHRDRSMCDRAMARRAGLDGRCPRGDPRCQPATLRTWPAGPRVRRARPSRRRNDRRFGRPDVGRARPHPGLPRRHHRPVARRGGRRGPYRAHRRHRRAHDHRRPHRDRAGHRRRARPRPRGDHRRRPVAPQRRGSDSDSSRSCTSSAASPRRTRSASPASCKRPARSSR